MVQQKGHTREEVLELLKSAKTSEALASAISLADGVQGLRKERKAYAKQLKAMQQADAPAAESGPLDWTLIIWKKVTRATTQRLPYHLAHYFHGHRGSTVARLKAELHDANPGASIQVWLDIATEKLEIQSEYASAVSRCVTELNALAKAAVGDLSKVDSQHSVRTVPCPESLQLSMPRLLRNLAKEAGYQLMYHSAARLCVIAADSAGSADDATAAVLKLCDTAVGCSTAAEEAETERREQRAAKAKAAAVAAAAPAQHNGHGPSHADTLKVHSHSSHSTAAADKPTHTRKLSAATIISNNSSSSSSSHSGSGSSSSSVVATAAAAARRARPPLAPLRTDTVLNSHSSGPSSCASESCSSARTGCTDGEDSPRASSIASSASSFSTTASMAASAASPVIASLLRSASDSSLFSESCAPWEHVRVGRKDADPASDAVASWDFYRSSWTSSDSAATEDDAALSQRLDLSSISFEVPPQAHVIASEGCEQQQPQPVRAALEPGVDPQLWVLLKELQLTKYAAHFGRAEVTLDTLPKLSDKELEAIGLPRGPRIVLSRAVGVAAAAPKV